MEMYNILIVEDESIIALDLRKKLQGMGYKVPAVVTSGEEAIIKADDLCPDLILMDILLKGDIDGLDAGETIKENQNIPILFLTSYTDREIVDRAWSISPRGILTKPYNDKLLEEKLNMFLS